MKAKIMLVTALMMMTLLVLAGCSNKANEKMNNDKGMEEETMVNDNLVMDQDEMDIEPMDKEEPVADKEEPVVKNKGNMAKTFKLKDLDGNTVDLKELMGDKVYLKFWASWCSVCVAGLDELDEFSAMDHDFEVITIVSPGFNGEKSLSKFKTWFNKQGTKNIRVLIDEDGDIARAYGIRAYPTSAFIGSDGVLVNMFLGHLDSETIKDQFDKIH